MPLTRRLPLLLLVVASTLVVVLALQNRRISRSYSDLIEQVRSPHPGLFVPTARLETLSGDSVTIGQARPGGRQVLFVFTTTCPYCRASLSNWQAIAGRAESLVNVEVYGVSLDSLPPTKRYAVEHQLAFPILAFPPGKLPVLYRAYTVPLTMIIDADGRIAYSRIGALASNLAVDSVMRAIAAGSS